MPVFGSESVRKTSYVPRTQVDMLPIDMDTLVTGVSASSLTVAETEAWVAPLVSVLDPSLNLLSFAMVSLVCRYRIIGCAKEDVSCDMGIILNPCRWKDLLSV